jgi:DnaJ-class molecular chaperone
MSYSKVTRLEVIDNTACRQCNGEGRIRIFGDNTVHECPNCHGLGNPGRQSIFWNNHKQIEISIQDDGRTMKIFINEREA